MQQIIARMKVSTTLQQANKTFQEDFCGCCTGNQTVMIFIWCDDETIVVRSPVLSQAVPLAPFTEANEEAMENKRFQRLLRKLGMRAPANEQVSGCGCGCDIPPPNGVFSVVFFLGILLENPGEYQRASAPEGRCSSRPKAGRT